MKKKLFILGTRGIPGNHGGFETFAEKLSLYLVKKKWEVNVYCQCVKKQKSASNWKGINRINIPVKNFTPLSSVIFDFKSILNASKQKGIFLILGYNTSIFNFLLKLQNKFILINMDGIEWKRAKWSWYIKIWFYINEYFGIKFSNFIIADNPFIKKYLNLKYNIKDRIKMIPYGGENKIYSSNYYLTKFNLKYKKYAIMIARPEPENSIDTIIRAFSKKKRGIKLIVLGNYDFKKNSFHKQIKAFSSKEIIFAGAIYDYEIINSLRYNSLFYIHGHQVGGTNPTLVEALSQNCSILAFDNLFNRWVAKNSALYFKNESQLSKKIDLLIANRKIRKKLSKNAKIIFKNKFLWEKILKNYEKILSL